MDVQELTELMDAHLAHIRAAATDNEFVDVAQAQRLPDRLRDALQNWDGLDTARRRVLARP